MLPTTHIAASCLLTAYTINSDTGTFSQLMILSGGSLLLHFALDLIPHGYIATPETIFKKTLPTIIEVIPGPVILLISILKFKSPIFFILAAFFGILPDLVATLYTSNRGLAEKIPLVVPIHRLHRFIHWFETDLADGGYSFMFSKNPLLVCETLFLICLVLVLFSGTF
jgi:hypothetical protein